MNNILWILRPVSPSSSKADCVTVKNLFGTEGHVFFPEVGAIMNLNPFDVMIDSVLSIIRLYFFFSFIDCFCAEK